MRWCLVIKCRHRCREGGRLTLSPHSAVNVMQMEEVKGLTFAVCSLVYSMCSCPLNHLWTFWAWHLLLTPFMSQSQKTENVLFRGKTMKKKTPNPLPTNLLLEMSVVTYDSQFIVIELIKLPSPYLSTSIRKKRLCSHLFPVFSLANCSCVSIYVKPPVHAPPPPPHPKARFLQ